MKKVLSKLLDNLGIVISYSPLAFAVIISIVLIISCVAVISKLISCVM